MITKEELLEYLLESLHKPMTLEEIMSGLQHDKAGTVRGMLNELEKNGQVVLNRKGRYGLPQRMNLTVGRIQGNAKGFAFLIPDNRQEQDVFILGEDLNGAMHNDRVIVRSYRHLEDGKKREGEVIRVLSRANQQVVGTYEKSKGFGFVVPDDKRLGQDIFIAKGNSSGAHNGDKVVAEMLRWPEPRRSPEACVIEVLGHKDDKGTDILSIVRKFQLPEKFPEKVLTEAEKITLTISPAEYKKRRDLRDLPLVTIDGEDAKDLDDAVSLEILENGHYRLGVHIADVGYYVPAGSLLDEEALKRATSVYLVDRVIPMLPPHLSNGVCSLNVHEDRLALTCFMEINGKAEVVNHELCQSIIRVRERLTYTDVRKILIDQDEDLCKRYQPFVEMLGQMRRLCLTLRAKRLRRGAIDFDFPEALVRLDEQGKPLEIVKRERSIAEMVIEEFMIAANETVAEHYNWLEVPFLYRVHEKPDLDDVMELNEFLGAFGYFVKTNSRGEVSPQTYQQVIERAKGQPEERAVSMTMLRSMKHARYAPEALGHFGLAAKFYSHFTAPIRRYPDLAIHRVIREIMEQGSLTPERHKRLTKRMAEYAEQSSLRERIAEEAERESVDLKKVEFMQDSIGEVFSGFISGVKSFGFFVELPNTVEGLVHVSTINDDYYQYNEKSLMLIGDHTKKTYQIGDIVKVRLTRVLIEERTLDFELVAD